MRESVGEGWYSLYSREGHLANVVTVSEPKNAFRLVQCHTLLHTQDVPIEGLALAARSDSTCINSGHTHTLPVSAMLYTALTSTYMKVSMQCVGCYY